MSRSRLVGCNGVVWFKGNDLRVADNDVLLQAHRECETVNHVFCFDPRNFRTTRLGNEKMSIKRLAFLMESLCDLRSSLRKHGSELDIYIGRSEDVLAAYCKALASGNRGSNANYVYCFDEVALEEKSLIRSLTSKLTTKKIAFQVRSKEFWGGSTLLKLSDLNFDIHRNLEFFTGFRKKVESGNFISPANLPVSPIWPEVSHGAKPFVTITPTVPELEAAPLDDVIALWIRLRSWGMCEVEYYGKDSVAGCRVELPLSTDITRCAGTLVASIADAELVAHPNSAVPFTNLRGAVPSRIQQQEAGARDPMWGGGERAADRRVDHYITHGLGKLSIYKQTRNGMLGSDYSSKLSVYLALGNISARAILKKVKDFEVQSGIANENTYWLIFELLWRDYMHFYMYKHGRKLFWLGGVQGVDGRGKHPWGIDADLISAWKNGRTGYPIIDANMRELQATGFMSNRGRQIVASFLVRDLKQDWRQGAEWFEAQLLDHDVCSNWGNWQYSAGVGADPREDRYFNIVKQGHDYDPQAEYIKTWCPELAHLPTRVLLDSRTLTDSQRTQLRVGIDILPLPITRLAMDSFPSTRGGGRGADAAPMAGSATGIAGGRGNKKKRQQHGYVPGR